MIEIKHLSKEAKDIYENICMQFVFEDDYKLILRTAMEAWDRMQEARRQIDTDGMTFTSDTGVIHIHPALKIEKESRTGFLMAWKMLHLDIESPLDNGRPAGS